MTDLSLSEQFSQATLAYQSGDLLHAQQLYQTLLSKAPDHAESHYNLAAIYARQDVWLAAIEHYKQALKQYPTASPILYNLSAALVREQQFGAAITYLQTLLQQDPEHAAGHYLLAVIFMGSHELEKAEEHFLKAKKELSMDPDLHYNLGVVSLHRQDWAQAKAYFLHAVTLNPTYLDALFNLAKIAEHEHETEQIRDYLEKCIQISADYFDAYYELVQWHKAKKDYAQALHYINIALKLRPHHPTLAFTHDVLSHKTGLNKAPIDYVKALFDGYAASYEEHLTKKLQYHLPQWIYEKTQSYLKPVDYRLLDLGCGTGLNGVYWRRRVNHLVGVDISAEMLAQARQKKIYDAIYENDIVDFLQKPGSYDLIIAADVWEYFGELSDVFAHIHARLTVEGLFVFSTEMGLHFPFLLNMNGRFTHHHDYIKDLLQQQYFTLLECDVITLRQQEGEEVQGELWIAQKELH